MDNKQKVLDALDALGVSYKIMEHSPVHTIEEMDALGIFTEGLPKDKQVEIQNGIRAALGCSRLSFGSDERLQKQLGLSPGAVSPFGVINDEDHDVVVVLDKELKKQPGLIGFHPNVNTAFLWLTFDGLMTFLRAMGNPVYCINL